MDNVTWWTAFVAIAQAVGAFATFTAVAISLWIARSERQLRAQASAGIRVFFVGDGSPGTYIVGVTILNTGLLPIRITSVGWRSGWLRRGPARVKYRYAVQNPSMIDIGKRPPFSVEPGTEETVFTTVKDMKQGAAANPASRKEMFDRSIPMLGDAPIYVLVSITGRKPILTLVEKSLANFLRTNEHPTTTEDS